MSTQKFYKFSTFSNSGHTGWIAGLSFKIVVRNFSKIMHTKFGSNWFKEHKEQIKFKMFMDRQQAKSVDKK